MADPEHDQEVSRRYRELGRDEPPPELDAKIRAAARRAAVTHPAPLVVPTGRRHWYFPVAAAAVIVLAVAVTWQVEREQRDDAAVLSQVDPVPEPKVRTPESVTKDERFKKTKPFKEEQAAAPAEPAGGAAPKARDDSFGRMESRARQDRPAEVARAPAPQREMQADAVRGKVQGKPAEETPERWLERIAELRQQGRHEEADKALAEFRKRYPDYKIPEAMLEKVDKK